MPVRVMSPSAVERLMQLATGAAELPLKILEHKERLENAAKQAAGEAEKSGGVVNTETAHRLAVMRQELDTLYADWAEGIERIRWCDMATTTNLTPDAILREAVYSTESVTGTVGVEALAAYMESHGCEDILKKLAERCLLEVHPLLAESLPLTEETLGVLHNPKMFFNTPDADEAKDLTVKYFWENVNRRSPRHVLRAMIAHIEFGLGEYATAIVEAGFARNEKDVPNFEEKLALLHGAGEVETASLGFERRKAEFLVELLAEMRQRS